MVPLESVEPVYGKVCMTLCDEQVNLHGEFGRDLSSDTCEDGLCHQELPLI